MLSLDNLVELSGGVHASLQLSPRQRDKTPVGIVLEPRTSLLMLAPMQIARWARMEVLLYAHANVVIAMHKVSTAFSLLPYPLPFTSPSRVVDLFLPCWALPLLHPAISKTLAAQPCETRGPCVYR